MRPDLSISIINHSNPHLLRECLRSIYDTTRRITLDVWVVDNATDRFGVAEMQAEFPQVQWLFNQERLGFSANHNQVLERAEGRYYCILNDDIVIHESAFDTLVEFMDGNPQVGMAGPRLLNADGSQQDCTFRFYTLRSELIDICFLPKSLCYLKAYRIDPAQSQDDPAEVDWVLGACIIVRDSALRQIGLLDSRLSPIANTEEVDWCFRAHEAGWKVAYCPSAVLTHYMGASMKSPSAVVLMRVEMYRTRLAYFEKHYGRHRALMVRLIYSLTFPWNVLMLTQGLLKKSISRSQYQSHLQTLRSVASLKFTTAAR